MAISYQRPLFEPESTWKLPDLATLANWDAADRVCLDVETFDPHLFATGPSVRTGGHLAGVGVGIEGGPSYYLPFQHEGGDNLPKENVMRYLRDQCKAFKGDIVGANLSYDLDWLWEEDVLMPEVRSFRDVLIAEPCINENKFRYSLDSVAGDWIGEQKDKTQMLEAARAYGMKKDSELGAYIHLLPARHVGVYGEQDVKLPLKILRLQEAEIKKQDIQQVWDLETATLPVLVRMKRRGVKVDEDALMRIDVRATKERKEAAEFITSETGVSVGPEDAMKKSILVDALRAAGHQLDADDAVDKHFIAARQDDCEVVAQLGRLRKWDTLRKLSIDPVKAHLVNGRIHCNFNQMAADKDNGKGTKGARYGRTSCEHVNMQQQPARDEEIGALWRKIYLPDDGGLWAALDYSQQEPRMLIHFAEICGMPGAKAAAQKYRDDPDADNHQMMADMAGIKRKEAKIIFLGLCYGMGQEKLCQDLGLPTKIITLQRGPRKGEKMVVAGDAGAKLFETFHTKVPFVKAMEIMTKERAIDRGFIRTILQRKCRFKMGDDGLNYWGTQKALNRLIQGSSADQTKTAMVMADRAGYPLQLQVHDEIDLTVPDRAYANDIAEIMRTCVDLNVPSKVDVEVGPTWGDAE